MRKLSLPRVPIATPLMCLLMMCSWLGSSHFPPWRSFHSEVFAGVALVLVAVAAWQESRLKNASAPTLSLVLLGVALLPVVQWAIGRQPFSGDMWIASLYVLAVALGVAVAYQVGRNEVFPYLAHALCIATLAGGLATAVIAMSQSFDADSLGTFAMAQDFGRAQGNLGQPNNVATLVGWALVSLLYLYERRRLGAILALSLAAVLAMGLAATQSRTGMLFAPLALVAFWSLRKRLAMRMPLGAAIAVCASTAFLMLLWPAIQEALLLSASEGVSQRGVKSPRFDMWQRLVHAIELRPWLGYGWLQVGAALFDVADDGSPMPEFWLHGHNLLLELVLWCGVPVGGLLGLMLCLWFFKRWRHTVTLEGFVGMLMLSFLGVHALLELPHHYLYFLVPASLWAGLVEAQRASSAVLGWRSILSMQAVFVAVGLSLVLQYPAVEEDFRLVRFEGLRIGRERATQPAPDAPMLSTLTGYLRLLRTPMEPGMSPAELDRVWTLTRRYPYAATLYRAAVSFALNGREAEAAYLFRRIYLMHDPVLYQKAKDGLKEFEPPAPEVDRLLAFAP